MTSYKNRTHRRQLRKTVLMVAFATLAACRADTIEPANATATTDDAIYESVAETRDGIGRSYMGRQISHVMGHRGAAWLERPRREREERTDILIQHLPLTDDAVVADIGAGTGYFSFPIAARVPNGTVLAVDIQPEMLALIEQRRDASDVKNVETVLSVEDDTKLAANTVDLILIVDAYHEFNYPFEMGRSMAAALKPGGRLILIEYREEDASVPIKRLHKMSEAQARREMQAIGLEFKRTEDFLPQQHFMVFQKP
ncbi:MAG: class I SAM-dependent methyltransferase [Pseudomonadota bacterium]